MGLELYLLGEFCRLSDPTQLEYELIGGPM